MLELVRQSHDILREISAPANQLCLLPRGVLVAQCAEGDCIGDQAGSQLEQTFQWRIIGSVELPLLAGSTYWLLLPDTGQ